MYIALESREFGGLFLSPGPKNDAGKKQQRSGTARSPSEVRSGTDFRRTYCGVTPELLQRMNAILC